MAVNMETTTGSVSGLSDAEAREFHANFVMSFIGFTVIALIAHVLVWFWRPWIPGPRGYTAMLDGLRDGAQHLLTAIV